LSHADRGREAGYGRVGRGCLRGPRLRRHDRAAAAPFPSAL